MFSVFKDVEKERFLLKTKVYLSDKPGSLAELSKLFAEEGINIVFFYYNRSEHPNRVIVEGTHNSLENIYKLKEKLQKKNLFEEKWEEDLKITETKNIAKIAVYLEHVPGTLAKFSALLKKFEANVIYMRFHEELSENRAEISFFVKNMEQLQNLFQAIKNAGYYYNIEYSGEEKKQVEELIGLNLVERFYLKLQEIIGEKETEKVKHLVSTSKSLSLHLVEFNKEAGKHLEAGQIFSNILTFALTSRLKKGKNFHYILLPVLTLGEILLFVFRLPTGGNVFVFKSPDNRLIMFDGTYGIYYEDVKNMLKANQLDPSKVEKIYLSHGDADHAGLSGYFEKEFGTQIILHKDAAETIKHNNRAFGTNAPIERLNAHFTVLVNKFTEFLPPQRYSFFKEQNLGEIHGFKITDEFDVFGIKFLVLESRGGHVPGQVFFLSPEKGLLFTADYLLNIPSLREEEKRFLSIPKFLMTSTNINSPVFREEMKDLTKLSLEIDSQLKTKGQGLYIFPGHGDYYPARLLSS